MFLQALISVEDYSSFCKPERVVVLIGEVLEELRRLRRDDEVAVDQVLFKGVVWVFENVLERFFELSPIQS